MVKKGKIFPISVLMIKVSIRQKKKTITSVFPVAHSETAVCDGFLIFLFYQNGKKYTQNQRHR